MPVEKTTGPLTTQRMVDYSRSMIGYEWFSKYVTDEERVLIHRLNRGLDMAEQMTKADWTDLKEDCLMMVGSEVASTISKICSAWRAPDIALSCFRDASEKFLEVCAANQKIYAAQMLKEAFKKGLERYKA